jgi:arylsulfatase A-like enzyme
VALIPAGNSPENRPDTGAASSSRLNVLLIIVDDLRPELACYGKEYIHSPNIDQLAASGLLFTHAYCQQATCNASRASFLLGMRPDSTRVFTNRQHFRDTVGREVVTLAEHFKNHQYVSVRLGKVFHGSLNDDRSWNIQDDCATEKVWLRPENQSAMPKMTAADAASDNEEDVANPGSGPPYEWCDAPDNQYADGLLTDRAIRQLQCLKDRRFFLAVGYRKPHLPFNAPKKYWDLYDSQDIRPSEITDWPQGSPSYAHTKSNELRTYRGIPKQANVTREQAIHLIHGYRACVSFVDTGIGRILGELERLNLAEDTMVILCGDNGFKLGEYSAWTKHTNYEIDTRVPLLIRVPGMPHPGARSDALVELIDIYPTICELAGLPLPEQLEGTSFVPLLAQPDRPWKQAAFSQFPRVISRSPDGQLMGYAMRTPTHLLVRWMVREGSTNIREVSSELYDVRKDPQQTVNVAADPKMVELVRHMESQGAAVCPSLGDVQADRWRTRFKIAGLRIAGFLLLALGAVGCVCLKRTTARRDRFDGPSTGKRMTESRSVSSPDDLREEGRNLRARCLGWSFASLALVLFGCAMIYVSIR